MAGEKAWDRQLGKAWVAGKETLYVIAAGKGALR